MREKFAIRATLKPASRIKNGVTYWSARGNVPVKKEDGTIAHQRVDIGLGKAANAAERKAECARLNSEYEERAKASGKRMTFARACMNYWDAGHEPCFMSDRIIAAIGDMNCADIDDTVMLRVAQKLFRREASPGYVNRHLYTPVNAVLKMASKSKVCPPPDLTRPKGHKSSPQKAIPDDAWYSKVEPFLTPHLRALVAFMTLHGRRLGDALNAARGDYLRDQGVLMIGKDKMGNALQIRLTVHVIKCIEAMPDFGQHKHLFRYGPVAPSNVRRDLQRACLKAGVPYFSPHSLGRHAFATRMLRAGFSLQFVKDAGGWKTIEMVSNRYGHLAHSEVSAAVESVSVDFANGNESAIAAAYKLADEALSVPTLPKVDLDHPLARQEALMRLRGTSPAWVYFFYCSGAIKIGVSTDVQKRLKNINGGNSNTIYLVGLLPGSFQLEGELKARFDKFATSGEWFRAEPELLRFIDVNADGKPLIDGGKLVEKDFRLALPKLDDGLPQ